MGVGEQKFGFVLGKYAKNIWKYEVTQKLRQILTICSSPVLLTSSSSSSFQ
jgi:hypothetical protein